MTRPDQLMTAPSDLVVKLRSQARAMRAGPNSLFNQAADTIERLDHENAKLDLALLRASQIIAASVLADTTRGEP